MNDLKSKLHEEQRRNIALEGQNYQLTSQVDKLTRSVEFCKHEMQIMSEEVEGLRKMSQKSQSKARQANKADQKSQALDEIRLLIQDHKKAVLS